MKVLMTKTVYSLVPIEPGLIFGLWDLEFSQWDCHARQFGARDDKERCAR
jgi:hypothetical protein